MGFFCENITKFGFTKAFFHKHDIALPGVKTFLSFPQENTEKSDFTYLAILDETADSKDTVLKVLNILHSKFQVGNCTDHVVVVGDGKSYDHLVKLKNEYGENMDLVLPYPGDWHILKNVLPIFIKIYFDAGLKQLATKHHHGATLKVLTECSKFAVSHRFFVQSWEAILRHQINSFLLFKSAGESFEMNLTGILSNILSNTTEESDISIGDHVFEKVCERRQEIFALITDDILNDYSLWRQEQSAKNQNFAFWDSFLHQDFMSYLGLFFAIRSRNWHLRNICLKKISCLLFAFDSPNYQRLIPYHLTDLLTFPKSVIDHFTNGCFSVSFSGKDLFSVALDEAHEMEINSKSKNALNSFSQTSLAP